MKCSKKLMCFLFLVIITSIIFLPKTNKETFPKEINREKITSVYFEIESPKISGSYYELDDIYITSNSNWEYTSSTEEWCYGGGTINNPYIIENCKIWGGIGIKNSTVYFEIRNCTLEEYGIDLSMVNNGKVINNFVKNYINVIGSNNIISGNIITVYEDIWFTDNWFTWCIKVTGYYNSIAGNLILPNEKGIFLTIGSNENKIYENSVEECDYGIYLEKSNGNEIYENILEENTRGIYLEKSDENKIYENNLEEHTHGIHLEESNENEIYENDIEENSNGIHLEKSNDNKIYKNDINENEREGISLDKSDKNKLYKNDIKENDDNGIFIRESNKNEIYKNTIESNHGGIRIIRSDKNEIYENEIIENNQAGIALDSSCRNLIYENSIDGNQFGILESLNSNSNYYFLNTGISISFTLQLFFNSLIFILLLIIFEIWKYKFKTKGVVQKEKIEIYKKPEKDLVQ